MKKIEFNMSKKFQDYCIENALNIRGKLTAHKMVTELLKQEGISKPSNLKVRFCSIADLKYKGQEIKGASIEIAAGKIFLEV